MNSVVRQLHEQGTDVVMVDTGNSYEGLCEYLGGKYISYTEEKPITMNPFNITQAELNIEKIDFLKNSDFTDMERVGHENHGTGVPHRRADGDGLLRRLLPRLRRLRPRAAREPAQDLDSRREAERQMECREPAGTGTERWTSKIRLLEERRKALKVKLAVVQYLL